MNSSKILKISYSKSFDKQLDKAPLEVKKAFLKRKELFQKDNFHPLLKNHSLQGLFKGHYTININGDWRAMYIKVDNDSILFTAIGTHSQLYRK